MHQSYSCHTQPEKPIPSLPFPHFTKHKLIMLKSFFFIFALSLQAVFLAASTTEIGSELVTGGPTGSATTGPVSEQAHSTIPVIVPKKFPEPIEIRFDEAGVPILGGIDPTEVPVRGLGILERVARAQELKKKREEAEAPPPFEAEPPEAQPLHVGAQPQAEAQPQAGSTTTS